MAEFTTWFAADAAVVAGRASRAQRFERCGKEVFWDRVSFIIIILGAGLVLFTFRDYGVTWDEDVHNWYGNFVLDYYLSFFDDKTALHWRDLYNYGAIFDTVAAALNRISPIGVYETRHLLNGLVGILGLIGCCKLARIVAGARAGSIATLFLLLTPNYYGQMFNNPKDIPFAVGMVWAIYYMVRIVPSLPWPSFRLLTRLGAAIGMSMGVRIGGVLLLCYLGLLLAVDGAWRAVAARQAAQLMKSAGTSAWRVLCPVAVVAYPVMLLFWPWAQTDPIENPLRALEFFSHQTFPFTVAVALIRRGLRVGREEALTGCILGIGIILPIAYAIAIKAVLFDGMRHFIFVLPLIAVVAAMVADKGLAWLERFPYRRAIWIVLALYGLAHVAIMAMLHPDQYVYYNAFVGGVEGAQHKFKLDYWANSYSEAVEGLEDYLRAAYGADFEEREFTVAVCGPPVSADYYFPPNFRFTRKLAEADFFIAFTKDNCDRSLPGRTIYRVERLGALLSVVLDRRDVLAERRAAKQAGAVSPSNKLAP